MTIYCPPCPPSPEEVLRSIAEKYFQGIKPSTQEEFNHCLQYLQQIHEVLFAGVQLEGAEYRKGKQVFIGRGLSLNDSSRGK